MAGEFHASFWAVPCLLLSELIILCLSMAGLGELTYQNYTDGRAIFFKTQGRYRNGQSAWENLIADGLETQELDVDHDNVFKEPYVRSFAERLKTHLSEAQRQATGRPHCG